MPAFEALLEEKHNKVVLDLLFTLATWHAFAKLRLHTEQTLVDFEETTTELGRQLRYFVKHTCEDFDTKELPKEHMARGRRKAAKAAKGTANPNPRVSKANAAKRRKLNLNTYKLHSLGDYPRAIRRFGTSDSYNTQTVSLLEYLLICIDTFLGRARAPTSQEILFSHKQK